MALGAALKRRGLTDVRFWSGLESICYYVFAPALFISSISAVDILAISPGPVFAAICIPIFAVTVATPLIAHLLRTDGPSTGSMLQGAVRFNTYIALIFASVLGGTEAVGTTALMSALTVPIVNTISVVGLAIYGTHDNRISFASVVLQIVRNPLILGSIVGIFLSLAPFSLPSFLSTTIEVLADGALVTGTLTVGAALTFSIAKRDIGAVLAASTLKLLILPGLTLLMAGMVGITGTLLLGLLLVAATPPAPSTYVMASKMGGNGELMTSIIVAQTLLSAGTIPLWLALAAA